MSKTRAYVGALSILMAGAFFGSVRLGVIFMALVIVLNIVILRCQDTGDSFKEGVFVQFWPLGVGLAVLFFNIFYYLISGVWCC